MILSQQIVVVAPATGRPALTRAQARLLQGKAKWIFAVAGKSLPCVPTLALTRAAWTGLLAERRAGGDKLRKAWVAALLRLVKPGKPMPHLVVRTSAPRHVAGLMPARTGLPAPVDELAAIDGKKALGRAITAAFASYGRREEAGGPEADEEERQEVWNRQIVIVQTLVEGELSQFLTRHRLSGAMGPVPMPGQALPDLPQGAAEMALILDAAAGQHMACLVCVSGGVAHFLSARPVEVGARAQLEAAVDRVETGVWTSAEAVERINPAILPQLLHPRLASTLSVEPVTTGLGVSPGAAAGEIVFSPDDAARLRARGRHCILVVVETGPGDIEGMKAATGFLTARGGMTSHAAVIARITGKPCVAGVRALAIDPETGTCRIGERNFSAGDRLTIDGNDGHVFAGALPLSRPHLGGAMSKLLDWADETRRVGVRTNAETIDAVRTALSFGAEGIGLARSEHMFFSSERMVALRRLIFSENEADRAAALKGLVDYQAGDYASLFSLMAGRPVTVRLFDPPLHEFLPRTDDDIEDTAASLGLPVRSMRQRVARLAEVNPMLGHRGCRLLVTYPEILDMQIRALLAGARASMRVGAEPPHMEVMVPFVSSAREVTLVKSRTMALVKGADIFSKGASFSFGTMIELPRAALRAGEIARQVDFFSFGTNDLTQTTFGISRDDAPAFLASYHRHGLYDADPFVSIDQRGVGELMRIAIERGRAVNPHLKIGVCGEHAGDPTSLSFFAGLGVDYVSCSPYRVPIARLTLAQPA